MVNNTGAALESRAIEAVEVLLRDKLGVRVHRLAAPLIQSPHARASRFDAAFEMPVGGDRRVIYVEFKARPLRALVEEFRRAAKALHDEDPTAIPLLVVPRLTDRMRGELRLAAVNHADLSGAMFLREPGFFVDLEGSNERLADLRVSRVDPFSDKASLVLRALLANPQDSLRVTDLANSTGLTKGWVSLVAAELNRRGYVTRESPERLTGYRLADPVRVLLDWSAHYSWSENRIEPHASGLSSDELLERLPTLLGDSRSDAALTLLAGAGQIAPHVSYDHIHLYVARSQFDRFRSEARTALFLQPVHSHGGTFSLIDPYYAHSALYDRQRVGELPVVSNVQLYLDLVNYPLRGAEATAMLVRTTLTRQLGLTAEQVRELV